MSARTRGSEEILVADNKTCLTGETVLFDWDLSASEIGQFSVMVQFASSSVGTLTFYACPTEKEGAILADFPLTTEGTSLGTIAASVNVLRQKTFTISQQVGKVRIIVNNAGASAFTLKYCRGRRYR